MKILLFPVTSQEFEEKVGQPPSEALPLVSPTSTGVYNSTESYQTHIIPSVGSVLFVNFGGFEGGEKKLLACVSSVEAPTPLHFYTQDVNPDHAGDLLDPQGYVCDLPTSYFRNLNALIVKDAFSHGALSTTILDSYPYLKRRHDTQTEQPPFDPQILITLAYDVRDLDCKPRHDQIRAFLHLLLALALTHNKAPISEQNRESLVQVLKDVLPIWMFHLTSLALKDAKHPLDPYGVKSCLVYLPLLQRSTPNKAT